MPEGHESVGDHAQFPDNSFLSRSSKHFYEKKQYVYSDKSIVYNGCFLRRDCVSERYNFLGPPVGIVCFNYLTKMLR